MNIFLKWIPRAFLFLFTIGLITTIGNGFNNIHILDSLLGIIIGSFILGAFFYFLEAKWIPKRKIKLMKEISKIFDSNAVTENITHFKLGMFDIYTELKYNLTISKHQNNVELITFHIPRNQIGYIITNRETDFKESECDEVLTYVIYQTNSWGLKLAKKRIERILN